ncbi:MAG: hypothetical protein RSC98_10040 [Clostridia bacterium]
MKRGGGAAHKEINRTNLTKEAIAARLCQEVTRRQIELLRMYNGCEAFEGVLTLERPAPSGSSFAGSIRVAEPF